MSDNTKIKKTTRQKRMGEKLAAPFLHFFFFIVFLSLACRQPEEKPEEVVARVGTEALTVTDIAKDIPSQFHQNISKSDLEDYIVRWIDSQVLYQEAKKRRLDQGEGVQRELRRLERELVVNALLEQELNKAFTVADQEIEKYYDDNPQAFARDIAEVHVQFINAGDNKRMADSLTAVLRQGGDFLQAARQFAASDSGGADLYLTEEETPPAVANAVFTMMTGSVSRPIQLDNGFHIFKMIEKFEAGSQRPLSQVRDEIAGKIQAEKRQERYKQLLAELKHNVTIERNLAVLESSVSDSTFGQ